MKIFTKTYLLPDCGIGIKMERVSQVSRILSFTSNMGAFMRVRSPIVNGKFYPADSGRLRREVSASLDAAAMRKSVCPHNDRVWAVMLPHAGYIYCGNVIADTLVHIQLPKKLIVFCPNHTGRGRPIGLWPDGEWLTPLGSVAVDEPLAKALLASGAAETDFDSHIGEHSIEVLLPFFQQLLGTFSMVPITVGTQNKERLQTAGRALAQILRDRPDVGVVVSSDMNHYEDHETTLAKDELALAQACLGDAAGLLDVTGRENISMCGAPALALVLFAARELGRNDITLTSHTTSGAVSGDYDHTVGYAGLQFWEN